MRIGLLQAGHLPEEIQAELGNYDRLYAGLLNGEDLDWAVYPVVDGVFPENPRDCDGWLVSGSRHGAYDNLPWIARLEAFLRDAYAARVPLVGICFGHQVIAQALGGRVEKWEGGWTVGRQHYDWQGEEVVLNAWHQDQVTKAPEAAEVVASSPSCANAALVYRDENGPCAFTVQAHPEFDARATELLLRLRAPGVVPEERIARAKASLEEPTDDRALGHRIAEFLRGALASGAQAARTEASHG